MMEMIEVSKLDSALAAYMRAAAAKNMKFSEYIESASDDAGEPLSEVVDSVGIVTRQDFEPAFSRAFIEEHFAELAEAWFKGLNSQVDFGITLDCVKDLFSNESQEAQLAPDTR